MREIKFRFYSKLENKMRNWEVIKKYSSLSVLDENLETPICSQWMQYTGLKDKNGIEIYEGDIIRIYNDEIDEEDSWIDEVSYHMGGFFSGDEDLLGNVHFRAKVIGNIYENHELLEGDSN